MKQLSVKIKSQKELILSHLEHARYLLKRTYPLVQEQRLFLETIKILLHFYEEYEFFCFLLLQEQGILSQEPIGLVERHRALLKYEAKLQEILSSNFSLTLLTQQKSEFKELLQAQKEGPADFTRKKEYVICEKNYKVRVISESSALHFLAEAEKFGRML